jgi:hypothetical protein
VGSFTKRKAKQSQHRCDTLLTVIHTLNIGDEFCQLHCPYTPHRLGTSPPIFRCTATSDSDFSATTTAPFAFTARRYRPFNLLDIGGRRPKMKSVARDAK